MIFSGALLRLDEPSTMALPSTKELELWKKTSELVQSGNEGMDEDNVVDMLYFASRYLCARSGFVAIYLCRPLLEIEDIHRYDLQQCFELAAAITAKDIECSVETGDESILVDTLSLLLDKDNKYYQEMDGKIVRNGVIDVFQTHGGFVAIAKYISTLQSALDFKFLKRLVEAAYSLVTVNADADDPSPDFASNLANRRKDVIFLGNSIMEQIPSIALASLDDEFLDAVEVLRKLRHLYLVFSTECDRKSFFQAYFHFTWRLLMSDCNRLKECGSDHMVELVSLVRLNRPPARTVTVSNAGCAFFNGVYTFNGSLEANRYADPDISYKRLVPATSKNDAEKCLKIVQEYDAGSGREQWSLVSQLEMDLSGSWTSSVTYYEYETDFWVGHRPPAMGWKPTNSTGSHPPPTLACHGNAVPPGEEFNTIEHQFAKWVVDNNILELIFCKNDTSSLTAGALVMEFVADVGSKSLKRNDGYLEASHVLVVWISWMINDDPNACAGLCACLVRVFYLLSDKTAMELLRAMLRDMLEWRKVATFCLLLLEGDYEVQIVCLSSGLQRDLQALFWRIRARIFQDEFESNELVKSFEEWINFEILCAASRKSVGVGKAQSALLEVPRSPSVAVIDGERRRICVSLPIEAVSGEFFAGMQVYAKCDEDTNELEIACIDRNTIECCIMEGRDKVTVEAILPKAGVWNVSWHGSLLRLKPAITPRSSTTCVDLTVHTIEREKKNREAIISMDEMARRQAGDIQSVLQKLRGPCSSEMNIKTRYKLLEDAMERGRATLSKLKSLIENANEESVPGIARLSEAIASALPTKTELESRFKMHVQKLSGKEFTSHVTDLMATHKAAEWLKKVDATELEALGGDSNRLYQLLVERKGSKKVHCQELDASTLEAAVARTDLFSKKQIKTLVKLMHEMRVYAGTQVAKFESKPSDVTEGSPPAVESGVFKGSVEFKLPITAFEGRAEEAVNDDTFIPPAGVTAASQERRQAAHEKVGYISNVEAILEDSAKENYEHCPELYCPISHVLMTNDPVLAADGHTYERAAVVAWFDKQQDEVEAAKEQFAITGSLQAQGIAERGILSPMTNEKLEHLSLTSNKALRIMARDAAAGCNSNKAVRIMARDDTAAGCASTKASAPLGQINN